MLQGCNLNQQIINDTKGTGTVVQLVYDYSKYGNTYCVGNGSSALAILGGCNSVNNGLGGSDGTVFVLTSSNELLSNYWTTGDGVIQCLEAGSSGNGANVWLNQDQPCTTWDVE